MPDRSKKRKKNKNKRKAKNNAQNGQNSKVTDVSPDAAGSCDESVTSEVNESTLTESCADLNQTVYSVETNANDLEPKCSDLSQVVTIQESTVNELNPKCDYGESKLKDSDLTDKCAILTEIKPISECKMDVIQLKSENQSYYKNEEHKTDTDNINEAETGKLSTLEPLTVSYIVESPEQLRNNEKAKLSEIPKSKSLDDIDAPKIVDITEDGEIKSDDEPAISLIDSNALVSEAESDVEWEMADGIIDDSIVCENAKAVGTLSVSTLPLNIAECEHTQALSPEEELSLRQYLQTLNLVTCPQEVATIDVEKEDIPREIIVVSQKPKKKLTAEDICNLKPPIPRFLEVIDEEGSNESSSASRRQSYLRDEFDDLDDDVFQDKNKKIEHVEKFPLPKSVRPHNKTTHLIPQECLLVDAKMMEPKIDAGCGDWTIQNVAQMTGAEVVYLTDSSSSASDIYDIGEEPENGDETDESTVRIITPTIEVNDSQNFLHNSSTDMVNSNNKITEKLDTNNRATKTPPSSPQIVISDDSCSEDVDNDNATLTDNNEIIVLTTENKNPNLYVLRINEEDLHEKENIHNTTPNERHAKSPEKNIETNISLIEAKECAVNESSEKSLFTLNEPKSKIDSEINDLKLELNNAISNLMKEVAAEKDNQLKENTLSRQDSSSSVGSSQCTAKYNPTTSSLTDIATLVHETTDLSKCDTHNDRSNAEPKQSHVKDVFERVTGSASEENTAQINVKHRPILLKDLCVRRIASLPYGEKILQELATVSERLQNMNIYGTTGLNFEKMPFFPLPDVSSIKKVVLPTKGHNNQSQKKSSPPPLAPRNSSLKVPHDEPAWTGVPTKWDRTYVCLSPSQKMLMEKTNTVIDKEEANELLDMHHKYVDRRGYNEVYSLKTIENHSDNEALPFKSQTGNRLLAIIRDPGTNYNINTKINKWNNFKENLNHTSAYTNNRREEELGNIYRHSNSAKELRSETTFRPIPPPRPRKYSSAIYESDESSDFTDHSFQSISERKHFHYSTGNLNKEIEKDISNIQDMHRKYTSARDNFKEKCLRTLDLPARRPSLPKDLCEQQMEYIRQKEKEVEAEIRKLELTKTNLSRSERKGPRAPLYSESSITEEQCHFDGNNYHISRKRDLALQSDNNNHNDSKHTSSSFKSSQEEIQRDKMYSEYICQMAEREERRQHKVIKIKPLTNDSKITSASLPVLNHSNEVKVGNNRIEEEFISKAKERWDKLGIKDPETEDELEKKEEYREPKVIEHKIRVIQGGQEKDLQRLPSHLREFVQFTASGKSDNGRTSSETVMIAPTFKARASSPAVWSPSGGCVPSAATPASPSAPAAPPPPPPPPPLWSPGSGSAGPSPQPQRKTFKPVALEKRNESNSPQTACGGPQAWDSAPQLSESGERRLPTSHSAPPTGLNSLGGGGGGRLPRAQNPTITLLQHNREAQLPRGPSYTQTQERRQLPRDRPIPPNSDPVHALRREYASESEAERVWEREGERARTMGDGQRKVDGIGPTTKEGMPVALRSEVKDPSRWYKKMYDTIHKTKYDDDYVTIRYKNRRGEPSIHRTSGNRSQYAYFDPRSGYLSEPEGGAGRAAGAWSDTYDSDATGGPRRRTASVQGDARDYEETPFMPSNKYSTLASARASQEVYKNQPGKIENYMPGRSSVIDKEAKQWWDEVMDIFDGQLSSASTTSLQQPSPKEKKDVTTAILSKSNMARALKESGYESDSTLVFRRRTDDTEAPLSPAERRAAYKDLQAGGEPPLRGFRSPAPPRQQEPDSAPTPPPKKGPHGSYSDTESPRRYVESDVNIHYRCPVRRDPLPHVPERELARRQAEHMRRLYQEERRRKYLQDVNPMHIEAFDQSIKELQDMQSRRHTDNFTPSQKSVVSLNRYDETDAHGASTKRAFARALYAFAGQNARELTFRKGDVINVRRQIDANWYEGELNGKVGLFPYNYVEIIKGDSTQVHSKPTTPATEGRARAKFDFNAQTNLELPLKKGEVVVLTRRIDQNWWEGRNGTKMGIFPDSYVTVLEEPSLNKPELPPPQNQNKPLASPASHGILSGAAKHSMGAHSYRPQLNSAALSNGPQPTQPLPGYTANYHAKPAQATLTPAERGYGPPTTPGVDLNNHEPLFIDTNAEAVPYRAMYKYRPQNPDELELAEGDTVYVLEKCDDGWYVGSSQRTGRFGTFPGNYVERI